MHSPEQASRFHAKPIQSAARAVAWLLVSVGIVGIVVGAMPLWRGLICLAIGVSGLVMARTMNRAMMFLITGGIGHLALFGYGRAMGDDRGANAAWLHLGFAVFMIALAGILCRSEGAQTRLTHTRVTWRRPPHRGEP